MPRSPRNKNEVNETKKIVADLLEKGLKDMCIKLKDIESFSTVRYEIWRRTLAQETLPQAGNLHTIMGELSIPVEKIYKVLAREPYNRDFYPKPIDGIQADLYLAKEYSNTNSSVLIYGMTNKKNGTTEDEIKFEIGNHKGQATLKRLFKANVIREINGRLKRKEVSFGDPDTNLRFIIKIAENALEAEEFCLDEEEEKTHGLSFGVGVSEKGNERWNEITKQVKKLYHEFYHNPEYRGDYKVVFTGLALHRL